MGPVGLITGTGLYELPGITDRIERIVDTAYGSTELVTGAIDGVAVIHIARHGRGHAPLSHQLDPRANIAALRDLGAVCAVATTVCGAVDPALDLGDLVVFDELHFPSNRLADGSLCTLFTDPSASGRGHWVYERPIADEMRARLCEAAHSPGSRARDGGVYGHVDGPRFNTRSEIASLAAAGVTAVSQTAGPEIVLAGEARLPFALIGFITDHANGVTAEPTPPETVASMFRSSAGVLAAVLRRALPELARPGLSPAGTILAL